MFFQNALQPSATALARRCSDAFVRSLQPATMTDGLAPLATDMQLWPH